jgi:hypothetical protein
MADGLLNAVKHALMITGFVFTMMLMIEYVNVLSSGKWQQRLTGRRWQQYLLAAFLGATPGCLGAFAVVTMYSHGVMSLGAVVATMIATSGDEAYVMLAMIPKQALALFTFLFGLGVAAGAVTDALMGRKAHEQTRHRDGLEVHEPEQCRCFPRGQILVQWRECSPARGILSIVLAVLILALTAGWVGPPRWNWVRVTILVASAFSLFIVSTVPDHFLEEHLWRHVARKHVPRVFLWTLGALLVLYVLTEHLHLEETIRRGRWIILLLACLVGIIPESGPHLIFVTLYAQGAIPLSILLASSVVQDGHGMLPMLADSRRAFMQIKAINFIAGLLCGALLMASGI